MGGGGDPDWAAQLAAAQAWWREAGLEHACVDTPRNWLARPAEAVEEKRPATSPPPPAPPPAPRIGGDRSRWPTELAEFGDWWLTEPSLDPVPGGRRVLPSGPAAAPLMVLVPQPEADDRDTLLGGPEGRLLNAILDAFGLSRDQVYLASVLPRATPLADWAELTEGGMGEVLAHHVALAEPSRLLLFGRGGVLALLGHDPAQLATRPLEFRHAGGSLPLMVAPALETLKERPALKGGLWTRWLDWTDNP